MWYVYFSHKVDGIEKPLEARYPQGFDTPEAAEAFVTRRMNLPSAEGYTFITREEPVGGDAPKQTDEEFKKD